MPDLIVERVSDELRRLDPDLSDSSSLEERMIQIAEKPNGRKRVFIIDEWDAVIREAKNDDLAQRAYLNLLRGWFKNANFTARAVAAQIEKIHAEETAPLRYNSEESLRSVVKLAYYVYRDHYLKFEELPAGEDCADVVYVPLPNSN